MSDMNRDETIILLLQQCIMYCSARMYPKQLKCNILASKVSFSHIFFISVSNHDGRIFRKIGELIFVLKMKHKQNYLFLIQFITKSIGE